MNKKLEKLIRYRGVEKWFYHMDRILRIRKIKVLSTRVEGECEGGKIYRVRYSMGFNKLNPLSWVFVLGIIIVAMGEAIKECIEDNPLQSEIYSDSFRVKDEDQ